VRLFLGVTVWFLVSGAFTLAMVIRDQQEATTVRVRLNEARIEKLIAEHNPFTTAISAGWCARRQLGYYYSKDGARYGPSGASVRIDSSRISPRSSAVLNSAAISLALRRPLGRSQR